MDRVTNLTQVIAENQNKIWLPFYLNTYYTTLNSKLYFELKVFILSFRTYYTTSNIVHPNLLLVTLLSILTTTYPQLKLPT
jgi:hypothetical protein